ncbi:MAG: hypothetical protein COT18_05235, partial [Elusimicrobia bacterium CG08_land_8_20_14_0_20_59_10]
VVDEKGKELAEAVVQIGSEEKVSGADGSFLFILSRDGNYAINASKTGYFSSRKTVAVSLAKGGTLNSG